MFHKLIQNIGINDQSIIESTDLLPILQYLSISYQSIIYRVYSINHLNSGWEKNCTNKHFKPKMHWWCNRLTCVVYILVPMTSDNIEASLRCNYWNVSTILPTLLLTISWVLWCRQVQKAMKSQSITDREIPRNMDNSNTLQPLTPCPSPWVQSCASIP